jgi:hypothetical protein
MGSRERDLNHDSAKRNATMLEAGELICVSVDYVRVSRHRERHQKRSHRSPRYRVRYRLKGQSAREAWAYPQTQPLLIWSIRASAAHDRVEIDLTENGDIITGWTNRTLDAMLSELDDTPGKTR